MPLASRADAGHHLPGKKVRKKIVQRVGIGAITPSVTGGDMVRVRSLMITPESGSSLA